MEWLGRDATLEQLLNRCARLAAIAWLKLEARGGKPFFGLFAQRDVAIPDLVIGRRALSQLAFAIERRYALDDAPRFAAIATGIHGKRAADCPGNACHKFGTDQFVHG